MKGFLQEVAGDLYRKYGDDISSLSLLFPSRRARLFFTDALAAMTHKPLWQPEWLTIDDLMAEISGLQTTDRVRLVTELYKVYSLYHDEPFDKFYFWGDMLLSDFDMIDKYMVDAAMLFRNIEEIKEIEADVSYLMPAKLKIIAFWGSFGEEQSLSDEKRRFLAVWRTLGDIYNKFRERLTSLGIAYSGMSQRAAAEKIASGEAAFASGRRYVVAGFNALSACEKRLFSFMTTAQDTEFYWDYDEYYTKDIRQEAGVFVRDNLAMFPPAAAVSHNNMASAKQLSSISTVSNAVQCKYVSKIIEELSAEGRLDKETAIVLTDENLLMPLLHSIPRSAGKVNVTMGYALKQSLAYSFIERLIELQSRKRTSGETTMFYHSDVTGLLSHPYIEVEGGNKVKDLLDTILHERRITIDAQRLAVTPLLNAIFSPAEGWRVLSAYLSEVVSAVAKLPYDGDDARRRVEFLAIIAENLSKLHNSLELCEIDLTTSIYTSLLRRHLQMLRIPFEGEPLEGIQVMGILETRNLDFKNVIILSMNDDNFPGNHMSHPSFIPYNLRAAYSLPTPEHHEGVYAYYFYRLIQRAENVFMLYCSHADEKSTGESSRYIYQLDYESGFDLSKTEVGVDVNLNGTEAIEVEKSGATADKLFRFTDQEGTSALSPTAFFRYVACPLRFYFYSVAGIRIDDDITDDVDAPMFGTILHDAMHRLYSRIAGEHSPSESIRAMMRTGEVERAVTQAVNENYLHDDNATEADYTGNLILVRDIVVKYIRGGIMPYDADNGRFTVEGLEADVEYRFGFRSAGRDMSVKFGGTADRIDRLGDGTLRVVDYKTGETHLEFAGINALFNGEARQRQSNILQTLLYSMMLSRSRGADTEPALYYVRAMNRREYSPLLVDKERGVAGIRYESYSEEFERLLAEKLSEMFDPSIPFRQCEDRERTCTYCDYKAICGR